ncbi:tyrosine-type recombinase/integrase [Amycolatopsis sp. H6(2020)]|nr:tyrosine-type recombinase/integrase [Amycolatopsis sp. H6(2020)]
MSHTFRRLIVEAGLPPVRFHDLRHGAATLSLAAGNDLKTVQALLGHAGIVLTVDTYTSVLPSLAQACAEATASLVRRAGYDRGQKICRSGAVFTRRGRRRAVGCGPRFIRVGGTLGWAHDGPSAGPQINKAHRQRP